MARITQTKQAGVLADRLPSVQRSAAKMRATNMSPVGAGQQGFSDRTQQTVPMFSNNPETFTDYLARWRAYVGMYQQSWEARKIVNLVPEDALRKPFIIKGISDEAQAIIKKKFDRLQLIPNLKRSLKLERLLGGCLTFMGLESEDDDPSTRYKSGDKSKLRFLNTIPVSRISRTQWETNPLSANFMRPTEYVIAGQTVHGSRCLVWDGEPLFDPQDIILTPYRSNLTGFGPSVLGTLFDDIIMACGTRQAAYQLLTINGAIIAAVSDLQDLAGTDPGTKNLKKIQEMVGQLSAFRAAIIDGEKVEIKQHSSSFGSVPELLMMYLQVLSAASDIPASRFLGEAPGGLSSGDDKSSKENYYNMLDSYQHEHITPQLIRLCDIVGAAEVPNWDKEKETLEIEWPPLWNETAKEQAERCGLTIDNVLKLVDAALMGEDSAIEELNSRGILSVKLEKDDLELLQSAQDAVTQHLDGTDPEAGKEQPAEGAKDALQRLRNIKPKETHALARDWRQTVNNKFAPLITQAGGDPSTIDGAEFAKGLADEAEHLHIIDKDSTPDDLQLAQIVLDHLKERPDYYSRLERVENRSPSEAATAIKRAPWAKKEAIYLDLNFSEREQMLEKLILGLPKGARALPSLQNEIQALAGVLAGTDVTQKLLNGMACMNPKKVKVSFTLGLNEVILNTSPSEASAALATRPAPTPQQISSGNYKKGHCSWQGLDITIENPKGSIRSGRDPLTLKCWQVEMPYSYGYLKRTTGADGDSVDIAIGPCETSDKVFIIDQTTLDGAFDEHKVFICCANELEAMYLHQKGFSDGLGERRQGPITSMTIEAFKRWLAEGDTTQPIKQL